jgi:hypothetical protein
MDHTTSWLTDNRDGEGTFDSLGTSDDGQRDVAEDDVSVWRCLAATRDGTALPPTYRGLRDHALPGGSRPEQPTTDASGRLAFGRCPDHQAVTIWQKER